MHWNPLPGGGGCWSVTTHAEVAEVSRDNATYSSYELTRRVPGMRLAGEPERLQSNWANGLVSMPVEFEPAAREA